MPLQIGFGEYDVTPPFGVAMAGYDKRQGTASGLHDPLTARAMVFDDGSATAALVVADVIGLSTEHTERLGRLVEQWTGIPRRHVIAAGTHTHSGPADARPHRGRPSPNQLHSQLLPDLVASAVKLAADDLRPATLATAATHTRNLTVNRRDPGGTTDEELSVVAIKRRGRVAGALLNFACHGVVMGPDNLTLSADWIGLARAALKAKMPGLFPLLAVAPSGNINPLPRSIREQMQEQGPGFFTNDPFSGIYDRTGGTFAEAEEMAGAIARAATTAMERADRTPTTAGIAVTTVTADIGQGRTSIRVPIRMVRVGPVVLVGMPGEQFVETGLRVKAAVRDSGLVPIVVSHAPSLAYVPTPEAFAQDKDHDYEVDWARRMGMAPDASDRELKAVERWLRVLSG